MSWSGRLLYIHIAEAASFEMKELDEAKLIAGRGIEGDRYPEVMQRRSSEFGDHDAALRTLRPIMSGKFKLSQ